jgi:hypothetical protein
VGVEKGKIDLDVVKLSWNNIVMDIDINNYGLFILCIFWYRNFNEKHQDYSEIQYIFDFSKHIYTMRCIIDRFNPLQG